MRSTRGTAIFQYFFHFVFKGHCVNDVLWRDNACWEYGRGLLSELLPVGGGGIPRLCAVHHPPGQNRQEEAALFLHGSRGPRLSVHYISGPLWRQM